MAVADIMEATRAAVSNLPRNNEDELYRLLAVRLKAFEADPSTMGNFAPKVKAAELGIAPIDLLNFGKAAFTRLAAAGHPLVCGTGADQGYHLQRLLAALSTDVNTVTAAVAGLLIAQLAIAPAIAGVVAALVVGKVAPTSVDALCRTWVAKLAAART
jgi:hypothetical protein